MCLDVCEEQPHSITSNGLPLDAAEPAWRWGGPEDLVVDSHAPTCQLANLYSPLFFELLLDRADGRDTGSMLGAAGSGSSSCV